MHAVIDGGRLACGAVANTSVMNLFVWPVLVWGILRGGKAGRTSGVTS
jgi:hypothetical protein